MEVSLQEILDAREQRVQTQRKLLEVYQKPLICFTMNIPGPEKFNRDVAIGFAVGNWMLRDALTGRCLHREIHYRQTGCEAFYVVDMPARDLKELTVSLEETDPIGRLFDMDVLDTDGIGITREQLGIDRRKCLICDNDASVCARSRAHSMDGLLNKINEILSDAGL